MEQQAKAPLPMQKGTVKLILSGDSVVVRGQPRGGPPPERIICLSGITAPKLARRPVMGVEESQNSQDEPFAWDAREFLRKKLIGKEVNFTVEHKIPSGREYGTIYLKGADSTGGELENVGKSLVAAGLADVRKGVRETEELTALTELEDQAKVNKIGKWNTDESAAHVRSITWVTENARLMVDQKKNKPVDAIIELVRDGSTMRAILLPSFENITIMLAGIKCPTIRRDGDQETAEQFAQEARYFTECRLLHREVQIVLEGTTNNNFLGTILSPAGNISELLLREGFAKCVDWSIGVLTCGAEPYRNAEKFAKEKQLRLWKDYVPSTAALSIKDREFTGKVCEIVNGDAIVVRDPEGKERKIFMSSLRPPRSKPKDDGVVENGPSRDAKRGRPLYDIPYMFEAREFMRKKLIGKKVNVLIDYIKVADAGFPERTCATVSITDINIAEALISKGLGTAIRYRQDDDQRSSRYDDLLAAENRAEKNGKGVHSKKEPPTHKIADLSGDVQKSRQFLPFLQRAGRSHANVEFVASGSRLRIYLPKETCLLTFLLGGISCPRVRAFNPKGDQITEDEPCGSEAFAFCKDMVLQRDVEVEVENIDKGGNFLGYMFCEGVNLSQALVENGLAKVHFTAERSAYFTVLKAAEDRAKAKELGVWKDFVEEVKVTTEVVEETDRKTNFKKVVVTEVITGVTFWAQHLDNATQFEQMQQQMRSDLLDNPPLPGSVTPKRNDLVASLFLDNLWYRARIEKVESADRVHVLYVDYGNREIVAATKLAALPAQYASFAPQAKEYSLACIKAAADDEVLYDLTNAFGQEAVDKEFSLNVEYKLEKQEFVSLTNPDTNADLAAKLIGDGWAMVEKRREKRLASMLTDYMKAQDAARKQRLNLWRYGDFTEDDAPEFGS